MYKKLIIIAILSLFIPAISNAQTILENYKPQDYVLDGTDLFIEDTALVFIDEFINKEKCGRAYLYDYHGYIQSREIVISLSAYCKSKDVEQTGVHEFFHIYCYNKCNYLAVDFPKTISPFGQARFGVQKINGGDDVKERLAFWATEYYMHSGWLKVSYPDVYEKLNNYFKLYE